MIKCRICIWCRKMKMSWIIKDTEESLSISLWGLFYCQAECTDTSYTTKQKCGECFWHFNKSITSLNLTLWFWCVACVKKETSSIWCIVAMF